MDSFMNMLMFWVCSAACRWNNKVCFSLWWDVLNVRRVEGCLKSFKHLQQAAAGQNTNLLQKVTTTLKMHFSCSDVRQAVYQRQWGSQEAHGYCSIWYNMTVTITLCGFVPFLHSSFHFVSSVLILLFFFIHFLLLFFIFLSFGLSFSHIIPVCSHHFPSILTLISCSLSSPPCSLPFLSSLPSFHSFLSSRRSTEEPEGQHIQRQRSRHQGGQLCFHSDAQSPDSLLWGGTWQSEAGISHTPTGRELKAVDNKSNINMKWNKGETAAAVQQL